MIIQRSLAIGLIGLAFLVTGCQRETAAAALHIDQAWARATPAGAATGAGYLVIINGSTPDRLLGASSPAAEKVELHESALEGAVMTMRSLDAPALAPGETLTFAPGGKHLMFVGLKAPFTSGAAVPVTLRFETAGDKTVELVVRNAAPDTAHEH